MKPLTQKVIVKRTSISLYRHKKGAYSLRESRQAANSKGDFSPSKSDNKWTINPLFVIVPPQKVIIDLVINCLTTVYQTRKQIKICYKRIKTTTGDLSPSKGDNKQINYLKYHFLSIKRRSLREQILSPCGALLLKRKNRVGYSKGDSLFKCWIPLRVNP